MRRLSSLLLIAAFATLAGASACKVETARAAPPTTVSVELILPAADSVCFGLRWTAVAGADSYGLAVTTDRAGDRDVTATFPDNQGWVCALPPAAGDTLTLHAVVWAVRAGAKGMESAPHTWTYSTALPPLPAPDSVWVDSVVAPPSDTAPSVPPDTVPPPAGDVGGDSLPSPVGSLFATPRAASPHFDFIRRTFTDFCYCWSDASKRTHAAQAMYDLVMSGDLKAWRAANPTMDALRYTLMQTTFTEEPDTNGRQDANSLTGAWQYDARAWFAAHPEYDYESMWLHDRSAGTPADSAHRLRFLIWANYRYAINVLDPGARAYTVDRLRRVRADIPQATGLFLDEMDASALMRVRAAREGMGLDTLVWQDSVVALVAEIRRALAPAMIQTNAAAYSTRAFDRRVGVAAGAMHLEQMNKATQDMPSVWAFVDGLLRDGVYVDLVNLETFGDFARYGRNFYPPGNYADAVGRGETFQLASYYMVVDSGPVKHVGLHDNGQRNPVTPDSTDLAIYYLDVGQPTGARYVWAETTDALGQTARTYRRDFTHAAVLIRPVTSYKYPTMTDTTAVAVTLPEGGPWSMVMARGQVVPVDSLRLRNSEAVILIRRQ